MTRRDKNRSLQLIELVIEEQASAAEVAELEQLVLADGEVLELFLNSMQLHGNLYWDAAGRGADLSDVRLPSPIQTSPAVQQRVSLRHIGLLATAAVVLIAVAAIAFRPDESTIAELKGNPDGTTLVQDGSETAPEQDDSVAIVKVDLPDNQQATQPSADQTQTDTTLVENLPQELDPFDDQQMVSFINDQIAAKWKDHELEAASTASDSEWVRRVHLDVAGRIPTTIEVEAFLKDRSPEKRQKLVDSLIESRDAANHFASTWTNLLVGRSADQKIDRQALFAYLERQFGNNVPWSQTVRDLLTSEGPADESGPANFLLAHLNNEAVPATSITTRILLCQQIQCSQCHRHPATSAWGQEKFWELNAFFQHTSVKERTLVDQETGEVERIRELVELKTDSRAPTFYEDLQGVMKVAYPTFDGVEIAPESDKTLREQLADLLIDGDDHQLAQAFVNRSWRHFFGYAFTLQVDDMGPHHAASHPELLTGISKAFVDSGYDVQRLIRWICLSDAYHLSSRSDSENLIDDPEAGELPLFSRMYEKPLSPEQIFNSLMVASGVSPEELYRRGRSYARREAWMQQFFTRVENEENSELTTFDGSLPQTLMMMNGELVQKATDPHQGEVIREILSDRKLSEIERINQICLAALSRYPTRDELAGIRQMLRASVRQRSGTRNIPPQVAYNEALRDVYWAYLNSSEFAVNR